MDDLKIKGTTMKQSNGVFRGNFLQMTVLSVSTLFFATVAVAQTKTVVIPLFETAEIDPSLVQTRVSGTCALGSFISAIADDGSVTCTKGGTAAVFSASGVDLVPAVPDADAQLFWLDSCLTSPYLAGPGETALVTALVGFDFNLQAQATINVASFEAGSPAPRGNGYFGIFPGSGTVGGTADVTVVHHIDLTEGVEYRFGAVVFPQGGNLTRSRLACQTMVQIVRVTP